MSAQNVKKLLDFDDIKKPQKWTKLVSIIVNSVHWTATSLCVEVLSKYHRRRALYNFVKVGKVGSLSTICINDDYTTSSRINKKKTYSLLLKTCIFFYIVCLTTFRVPTSKNLFRCEERVADCLSRVEKRDRNFVFFPPISLRTEHLLSLSPHISSPLYL